MSDPVRLREGGPDVPPELQQLFDAGAKDLPTDGDLRRLAARLGPVLEPHLDGGSGWPSWPTIGKVAAVSAVVAGTSVLFALKFGPPRERPPDMPESVPAPPETSASVAPVPSAPPASSEGAEAVPAPSASSAASESASARAAATRPAETEAELLERARGVLASNPARALAITDQHRARFPAGVLTQEREVIAIQALKHLGRTDEAARRAADFARHYPNSAYGKKLNSGSP